MWHEDILSYDIRNILIHTGSPMQLTKNSSVQADHAGLIHITLHHKNL